MTGSSVPARDVRRVGDPARGLVAVATPVAVAVAVAVSVLALLVGPLSVLAPAATRAGAAASPPPPGVCPTRSLSASGSWQGATGSMLGAIDLANLGRRTCALRGYATITLQNQAGRVLRVTVTPVGQHLLPPAVKRPPLVTLPPQQQPGAVVPLQWFNWCGPAPGNISVTLTLPGRGRLAVHPISLVGGFHGVARCDEPRRASRLSVGPISWPTTPTGQATAIPVGTPACASSQLRARGGRQGGGFVGEALGQVVLTNAGPGTCVLSGTPSVALLTAGRQPLPATALPADLQVNRPRLLRPGASGGLDLYWSNWCGAAPGPLDVAVTPAGDATPVTGPFDGPPGYDFVPACRDAAQPSTLTVTDAFVSA